MQIKIREIAYSVVTKTYQITIDIRQLATFFSLLWELIWKENLKPYDQWPLFLKSPTWLFFTYHYYCLKIQIE